MKDFLVKFFASGLFSGYLRPFPGTWGTIPAWLLAWFVLRNNWFLMLTVACIVFLASVWLAGEAEKKMGHDSRKIVIDEWTGILITMLFVPPVFKFYVAGFVAFRVFDVIKIPPARQCEKLPAGLGITMDDVIAGIQANIFIHLVIFIVEQFVA